MRGPTLFSGYWRDDAATAEDFRGGWFHMGDMFCRRPDGCYDYVDRRKYLIKSGGENIYPAEIERVLLGDPRVADAVVVRRKDARWGEVPIALVVAREAIPDVGELATRCRAALAGFKQPKEIRACFARAHRALHDGQNPATPTRGVGCVRGKLRTQSKCMHPSTNDGSKS